MRKRNARINFVYNNTIAHPQAKMFLPGCHPVNVLYRGRFYMRPIWLMILSLPLCGAVIPPVPEGGNATVQMIVTAEARQGKTAPVPSPGDFSAGESETQLHVTDVTPMREDNAGLELFLVLDDASASSLGSQLSDLKQFILAQPSTTLIGIGYMSNGGVTTSQRLTADHAHAAVSLRLPFSITAPSPYLSLSDLVKHWPGKAGSSARREIVMVSSGMDPLGGPGPIDPYLDNAIQDAQRAGVIVYTIYAPEAGGAGHAYFSSFWGQNHLAQLAEETGGAYYMLGLGPAVSFAPYLDRIAEHLANQYRVAFEIHPEKKAGYRSVRLHNETGDVDLVYATKVYVAAGR
jgi:hypothetical protein